jgi:hypothetical protein
MKPDERKVSKSVGMEVDSLPNLMKLIGMRKGDCNLDWVVEMLEGA